MTHRSLRETRHDWVRGAVIVLIVLAAYIPALYGGYIWDDDVYVTNNPALTSVEGLWASWTHLGANVQYYPLVFTSFWLEYHFWQLSPFGYHLVNVVLHLLNTFLVWHILRRLEVRGAWLAAALFAIDPVQVESVAWITELKNVLSGLFYLAAAAAYLRYADYWRDDAPGNDGPFARAWPAYVLAFVLFTCALLSKSVTATLPVILLVVAWWKRGTLEKSDVLPLVPFLLLAAAMGSVTRYLERVQVGATGGEWNLTLIDRVLIAGRAVWFYVWKDLLPIHLVFSYPRWSVDPGDWRQYLFPLSALATVIVLYLKRERIGRGALAAFLFFVITLAPALGFFDVYPMRYSFVADHFQYLASLGPIVLLSAMLSKAADRLIPVHTGSTAHTRRLATRGVMSLLLVTLAVLTWRQSRIYRNELTLWSDTIRKNPDSWMAYNNLGLFYFRQGDWGRALPLFQKSLKINPDDAEAHYNLALVLRGIGREADAESQLRIVDHLQPKMARQHRPASVVLP